MGYSNYSLFSLLFQKTRKRSREKNVICHIIPMNPIVFVSGIILLWAAASANFFHFSFKKLEKEKEKRIHNFFQ